MLTKLKLKDFQSHKDTEFNFGEGLNVIVAPSGCLSGDTLIQGQFEGTKTKKPIQIKRIFKYQQGGTHPNRTKASNTFYVFNYDEKTLERKRVRALAVYSGKKQCYLLITKDGHKIEATADHKFFTKTGWVKLKDLKIGEEIYYSTIRKKEIKHNKKYNSNREFFVKYHPNASVKKIYDKVCGKEYTYYRIPEHKAVYEAFINGLTLDEYISILKNDEKRASTLRYIEKGLEFHHKDLNHYNNNIDNIMILTKAEHAKIHQQIEHRLKPGGAIYLTQVVSIEKTEIKDTYDMMCDTFHNFVANGLLVHNSGKTATFRALYYLFKNKPTNVKFQRRPDAKSFTIEAELDGHTYKRTKGEKVNSYELDNKKWEDIGTNIPQEVIDLANIKPIQFNEDTSFDVQFSKQFDPHFLLFESDAVKAKFLNRLSGSYIVDLAIKNVATDISTNTKTKEEMDQAKTELTQQINYYKEILTPFSTVLGKIKEKYALLKDSNDRLGKLKSIFKDLSYCREKIQECKKQEAFFSKVNLEGFDFRFNRLSSLYDLRTNYQNVNNRLKFAQKSISSIDGLQLPTLEQKTARYANLVALKQEYSSAITNINYIKEQIDNLDKEIQNNIGAYIDGLKEQNICPTCGRTITKACIDKIAKELRNEK